MSPQHPGEYGRDGAAEQSIWLAARRRLADEARKTARGKDALGLDGDLCTWATTFADLAGDHARHEDAQADLQAEADLMEAGDRLARIQHALDAVLDMETWKAETLPDLVRDLERIVYGEKEAGS